MKNHHTVLIKPFNSAAEARKASNLNLCLCEHVAELNPPLKPVSSVTRKIHLIQLKPGEVGNLLKQIESHKFVSVPTNYLLGIGVADQTLVEKCSIIYTLDDANLFPGPGSGKPCNLCLEGFDPHVGACVGIAQYDLGLKESDFGKPWYGWFAVMKKG